MKNNQQISQTKYQQHSFLCKDTYSSNFFSNSDQSLEQYFNKILIYHQNLKFEIVQQQATLPINTNKLLGGGCGKSKQSPQSNKKNGKKNQTNNIKENKKSKQYALKPVDLDILKHDFIVVEDNVEDRNSENQQPILFEKFYQIYYKDIEPVYFEKDVYVREIIKKMHKFRESIAEQSRNKVIDLINLVINFLLIILNDNHLRSQEKDVKLITGYLEDLKSYCYENRNRYPCLDLFYYFDTLITLNDSRKALDIVNKSKFTQIFELIIKFVKIGVGFVSIQGAISSLVNANLQDLNKFFRKVKKRYQTLKQSFKWITEDGIKFYDSYTKGKLKDKIQILWFKRINTTGDDVIQAFQLSSEIDNVEEEAQFLEIFFYIDEIFQMRAQSSEDIVLFSFMQLNYLLSRLKEKDIHFSLLSQKIQDRKKESSIIEFVHLLQLSNYSATFKDKIIQNLTSSIIVNTKFRYIRMQLMLKFAQILLNIKNVIEYHKIMINLCTGYLQEKDVSIKILFQKNQVIAQFIQKKDYYDEMIKESKRLRKQYKLKNNSIEINAISNKIETQEDILRLLAINFAEMWEISVKQRQDSNKMAHKDDALLEALNLYIKQYVTYEQGYKFINNTIQSQDPYSHDAVKLIIDNFLIPNFQHSSSEQEQEKQNVVKEFQYQPQQELEKYKNKQQSQKNDIDSFESLPSSQEIPNEYPEQNSSNISCTCKILSILAEGGSGKSMLLKKLEVELLKEKSQTEYRLDEKSNYLPFIIKCNQLDSKNPSIENYLQLQNLSINEIKMLKSSEKNKLILLDGYDEYAGDYFKVYEQLRLFEWVNTLVIVTSRLEKISVSDAKLYFNYYDSQGNEGSGDKYAILKLNKMDNQDIKNYLKMFKDQKSKSQPDNFNSNQLSQFETLEQSLFANNQLIELLKLPINLYLITRMMADLNLDDQNTLTTFQSATDQVEIQELFFSSQFKKQSHNFVETQTVQKNNEKQMIIEKIQSIYFEYFQTIAMIMFVQKGKKSNFLSTTRESIKFSLREEQQTYLQNNQIKTEDLMQNLNKYVDARVITRINQSLSDSKCEEFEFRHKSLFEYFVARAMKYDFDVHQENIFQMNVSALSQFSINKRIIMSSESNASEYQVLLKLYKLIKPEIDSILFKQNYSKSHPSETSRYIQYLRKSKISKITETSEIDIGSSNLLSALFVSKFCFPQLIFQKCSFTQVYISSEKSVDFELCNLQNSYLGEQQLQFFESSNTKNTIQDGFLKVFDFWHYSSDDILIQSDTIYSLNNHGYIHKYQITGEWSCRKLLSNQFSINSSECKFLKDEAKEFLIVQAQKSIFEIDKATLEVMNYFKFTSNIANIQIEGLQYLVTLENKLEFEGNFIHGFKTKNENKSINQNILTNNSHTTILWKKLINKTYENKIISSISFSKDGNYLSATFLENKNQYCTQLWSIKNSFEIIKTIYFNNARKSEFSFDFKYIALISSQDWGILNIDQGFLLEIQINEGQNIESVAFSPDSNYFVVVFNKRDNFKIYDIKKKFLLIHHNKMKNQSGVKLNSQESCIKATFSSDGRYLLTSSKILNIQDNFKPVKFIDFVENQIYQAYFSPDMSYFYTIRSQNMVRKHSLQIWNIKQEFKYVKTINFDSDYYAILSPNCKILATLFKNQLQIRSFQKGLAIMNIINFHPESYEFSPDSKYIVTCSLQFEIWNIEIGFNIIYLQDKISLNFKTITAFSPDGKNLFLVNIKCCKIFNTDKNFDLVSTFEFQEKEIKEVFLSKDCQYLAILSFDNCSIYNIQNQFKLFQEIKLSSSQLDYNITFAQDSKQIAISGSKYIQIYNVEKQLKEIKLLKAKRTYKQLCFSPDGKYLAMCLDSFNLYDIQNQQLIILIKRPSTDLYHHSSQFSSDSKYLAVSYGNDIYIFNAEGQLEQLKLIKGEQLISGIFYITFSLDNKLLIASNDLYVNIWNVEKNFELIETIQGINTIKSVDISPDNKYISIYSILGKFRIWNIENINQPKDKSADQKQAASLSYYF